MLSINGGFGHRLLPLNPEREYGLRSKIVRVNPSFSSFLSGIQAIITELGLRTERKERLGTYTVISTALLVRHSQLGRMLQVLTTQYQAVVVVSSGTRDHGPTQENVWPATVCQHPGTPIIVVSGVHYYLSRPLPSAGPFITLNAPRFATCKHITNDVEIVGISPAIAIVTAQAADMLARPKVRTKLFIDNPDLAPDEQKLMALRPVSANIRDYIDSLAFDHGSHGVKGVWNGLDPGVPDINQYRA